MYNKVGSFSLFIILLLAFTIQVTILEYIKLAGARPDIMVLFVVFFGLFFGAGTGFEAGLISGLLKDIYSLDIFGVNTVILALTGLIVGALSPKFFKESIFTQFTIVFVFMLVSMLAHFAVSSLIRKITYISMPEYLFRLIIPSSLYTALLSFAVFPILIKRYHLNEKEDYL